MEIKLTWNDLNYGTQRFEIYRDTAPFDDTTLPAILDTLDPEVLEYVDTDIVVGNTYYYRVGAFVDNELMLTELVNAEVVDAIYTIDRMIMQRVIVANSSNLRAYRMIMQVVTRDTGV